MSNHAYIELKDICKSFGSVLANKHINFSLDKGEIHALLGENGSGKSTLVNMLSGIYIPDSGFISINGRDTVFTSPQEAIAAGIGMVHQHFKLVGNMTAWENIAAGCKKGFLVKGRQKAGELTAIAQKYGLSFDPYKYIDEMSVSEQQTVEIMKMLYRGAHVLILDEPTAVLTPQEIIRFFAILRNMKKEGCAIIIITHKMNEVLEISDRVTVLRKGEAVGTVRTAETSAEKLTEMMIGRRMELSIKKTVTPLDQKTPLLDVQALTVLKNNGLKALDNVSFRLFSGEILGVAGIAASGQKELCEAIAGLTPVHSGNILLKDVNMVGMSPALISAQGVSMSFVPEDRLGMGLVANLDIVNNVLLKSYRRGKGPYINITEGEKKAQKIVSRFEVSTPSVHHQVRKLSGGNIQKVLLGREVDSRPQVLITAYPARGLDIGAAYNIYNVLDEERVRGVGVLYVGEDLDVLLELCDRIMVISHGRVMGIADAGKVSKEELGLLMLGEPVKTKEASYA